MIESQEQYEITRGQLNAAAQAAKEYKSKLKGDKDNLKIKLQYDAFKGQVDELKEEIRVYEKFRRYVSQGKYDKISEMCLDNSKLKEDLSKDELLKLADYYEENIKGLISKALNKTNQEIKKLNKSLEKNLNKMEMEK